MSCDSQLAVQLLQNTIFSPYINFTISLCGKFAAY